MFKKNGIIILTLAVLILVVLVAVRLNASKESEPSQAGIAQSNCQISGGTYEGDQCVCPVEYDEQLAYDSATGYCMSSFGTPGGTLGDERRQELESRINANE